MIMGKTKALEIYGNSNVGLFAYATDEYGIIGKSLPDEVKDTFTKALDVPFHELTIGGSQQVGVYLNGNSTCLLVPSIIYEYEKDTLDTMGITYVVIHTKNTALGNNLIIGDDAFFYMPDFEDEAIKEIEQALGLKGKPLHVKGWEVIGSIVVINSKGGLIQKDVPEDIKTEIEDALHLTLEPGTVNFGSHVIGGGIVVNGKGMVIGKASAGIEITNADMAFGFLE